MLPAETVLTSQFGVSRPVIREALKALEGRNVIEIINGRGAVIKALDSKDLHGFFNRAVHFSRSAYAGKLPQLCRGIADGANTRPLRHPSVEGD